MTQIGLRKSCVSQCIVYNPIDIYQRIVIDGLSLLSIMKPIAPNPERHSRSYPSRLE